MFFNDCTKLVVLPGGGGFRYIQRKGPERQDFGEDFDILEYPPEMSKKMNLLKVFRGHLEEGGELGVSEVGGEVVYVKKWMRTRHAIIFRLSNHVVQVNFQDKTEILLSSESRMVTYLDKRGERSTYPLAEALESENAEMTKRLKYTKDILTHMLNNNNKPLTTGGTTAS